MHPLSSSTSSSNGPRRSIRGALLRSACWTLLALAIIDAAVGWCFRVPADPRAKAGALEQYFEYGRSIEGKLQRGIGKDDASTDLVALAGWITPDAWNDQPNTPEQPGGTLVSIYGMSFTIHAAYGLKAIDPQYTLRYYGGPAAPANHSYAAYLFDRPRTKAPVVMLGILASSVRAIGTLTGQTWAFESPYAYTYPKFTLRPDGSLEETRPVIASVSELREALARPEQWTRYVGQLRAHDSYYNEFLFRSSPLDHSTVARLLRRGWSQHHNRAVSSRIHDANGFNLDCEEIKVLRAIVTQFAQTARADGRLPILLLVNDQGYGDHLFRALEPVLKQTSVPYVSTHSIAPADDLGNFVADGHFTSAANKRIAKELDQVIKRELK